MSDALTGALTVHDALPFRSMFSSKACQALSRPKNSKELAPGRVYLPSNSDGLTASPYITRNLWPTEGGPRRIGLTTMAPVPKPREKRSLADLPGDVGGHRTLHLALFKDVTAMNHLQQKKGQTFSEAATTSSAYITGPIVDVQVYSDDPDTLALYVLHNESPEAVRKEVGVRVTTCLPQGSIQYDQVELLGRRVLVTCKSRITHGNLACVK